MTRWIAEESRTRRDNSLVGKGRAFEVTLTVLYVPEKEKATQTTV